MKLRFYFTIGFFLLVGGILMDSGQIFDLVKHKNTPSSTQVYAETSSAAVNDEKLISGMPDHISMPSVNISLPVQPGNYDASSQTWTLGNGNAYFATITVPPNNKGGNTFMYGHDIPSAFKRLNDIKPGEKAVVTTENGHRFTYEFVAEHDTDPNDTSLFTYKGSPVLTLQTCSGFFSQYRRLFVFKLVEAA